MSDDPNAEVLDYLRARFAPVHEKLDRVIDDVGNLKVRGSALEAEAGYVRVGLADVNSRLDRLDARVERIGQRLELTEA
jgi:hypothetical protein